MYQLAALAYNSRLFVKQADAMSVFSDFPSFRAVHQGCVATIGKYDGMHIGHQHVLNTLCRTAAARGLPAVVIVSEPHPEEFFSSANAAPRPDPISGESGLSAFLWGQRSIPNDL